MLVLFLLLLLLLLLLYLVCINNRKIMGEKNFNNNLKIKSDFIVVYFILRKKIINLKKLENLRAF